MKDGRFARAAPKRRRGPAAAKHGAYRFGVRAERVAAIWLMLKGYRILERRHVNPGGEIDLIAMRGNVIAFVEVKARPTLDAASLTITAAKRGYLHRAIRYWVSGHPWAATRVLRADAVFVAPRRWPRHLVNAFDLHVM